MPKVHVLSTQGNDTTASCEPSYSLWSHSWEMRNESERHSYAPKIARVHFVRALFSLESYRRCHPYLVGLHLYARIMGFLGGSRDNAYVRSKTVVLKRYTLHSSNERMSPTTILTFYLEKLILNYPSLKTVALSLFRIMQTMPHWKGPMDHSMLDGWSSRHVYRVRINPRVH
jgi:hypothetical protein